MVAVHRNHKESDTAEQLSNWQPITLELFSEEKLHIYLSSVTAFLAILCRITDL